MNKINKNTIINIIYKFINLWYKIKITVYKINYIILRKYKVK